VVILIQAHATPLEGRQDSHIRKGSQSRKYAGTPVAKPGAGARKYLASARALEPSLAPTPDDQNTTPTSIFLTPSPRIKTFHFSSLPLNPSIHPSIARLPPKFDAFVALPLRPCVAPRRAVQSARRCASHGHRGRGRIRQCLRRRRRRRVRVLLLRPARHPQERLRHRHPHRLPEARDGEFPSPCVHARGRLVGRSLFS